MFIAIVVVIAVVGLGALIWWLTRWSDPSWTNENQRGATWMWSKRGGGGR